MAFADVLEETLAVDSTTEGLAVPPPAASAYARPLGFFLFNVAPAAAAATGLSGAPRPVPRPVSPPASRPVAAMPRPPARVAPRAGQIPRRMLSPRQLVALRRLEELGADLGTDFTPEELRSAYRRLARRYHPDHHTDTTDAERHQLARLFSQASDSYAELQDVLAPAA
jgi:hypothetical protein